MTQDTNYGVSWAMIFESYHKMKRTEEPRHAVRVVVIVGVALATVVVLIGLWSERRPRSEAASKVAPEPQPSAAAQPTQTPVPAPAPASEDIPPPPEWAPVRTLSYSSTTHPATPEQLAARNDLERFNQDLGTFPIDGRNFMVRISWLCMKGSASSKSCDVHNTTAESLAVLDESGTPSFTEKLDVSLPDPDQPLIEGTGVRVALFNGKEHKVLALVYQNFPSSPGTGCRFRLLAMRAGSLTLLNPEPVYCGEAENLLRSKGQVPETDLLPGDVLEMVDNNQHFFFIQQMRINWKDFRLEEKVGGDFEVEQTAITLKKESTLQVFASSDDNAAHSAVTLPAGAKVEFIVMRFSGGGHEWLKVRIDGKDGWITGDKSYEAVGLPTFG
jgi:hypothetical protein